MIASLPTASVRTAFIFSATVIVGILPIVSMETVAAETPSPHPDLLVYLADDLSALDLPIYGGTNIQTPHLSRLAAAGMVFDRAFVASPACAPSRAALLTGLMPARNGAEQNHSYPREDILRLPCILKELGYQTAAFGKVAHNKSAKNYGFDVIELAKEIPQMRVNVQRFLKNRKDTRPLALFVGTADPHVPWPAQSTVNALQMDLPAKLLDTPRTRVQRSRYLQEVKNLDAYLGELMQLSAKHMSDDTLYVFSSDHGAQFPFGKWCLYDEGTRVPLIVARKGFIKPGTRTSAMVSWIDVLPTLIDVAGGDVPDEIDGRSFKDVLTGKTSTHRDQIFTTHSGDRKMNVYLSRAVRTAEFKLIHNLHPEFAFTTHIDLLVRETSGDYFKEWREQARADPKAAAVVAAHHGRPEFELFDLNNDPFEQNNLAEDPSYAETKSRLLQKLQNWMQQQGDQSTVFHEPLMLDEPDTWVPRR